MKFKFTIHHHFHKGHLLLVRLKLLHHRHHFFYIPKEIFFLQKVIYELHVLYLN